MMNSKINKLWIKVEDLIIYSPFIVTFIIIFNFPDSKHFVSRVTIVSALYCAVRFYPLWKVDLKEKNPIIIGSFIFCGYFFFMQYLNDGNSDLPRSVLYLFVYFIFFPLEKFNNKLLYYFLIFSSFLLGVNAYYQVFYLGIYRAGFLAINPIPYSYFSGICLIILSYFTLKDNDKTLSETLLSFIGIFLSFSSIILTQTRATLLAILIVFVFSSIYTVMTSPSRVKISSVLIGYVIFPMMLWNIPIVQQRITDVVDQIHNYNNNDYSSSSGIRLKLWESGLDIASGSIMLGTERHLVMSISSDKISNKTYPSYLSVFLIHPNANFHNQYIQALVDSGLLGLILFLFFISIPFIFLFNSENYNTKLLGMSISIFTAICLCFDSLFLYNHTVILYSLVIMISFGVRYNEKEEL
ncbi:O-antigen ligase family protein [Vibrio mimicus]